MRAPETNQKSNVSCSNNRTNGVSRRSFLTIGASAFIANSLISGNFCSASGQTNSATIAPANRFRLRYVLGSLFYGKLPLDQILPEIAKTGSEAIDIWPPVHADQRKFIDLWGAEEFVRRLKQYNTHCALITRYDLKPNELSTELSIVRQVGAQLLITGAPGRTRERRSIKDEVRKSLDLLAPAMAEAKRLGVKIGIENHSNMTLDTFDSIRYFAEQIDDPTVLGIALAPYHLPQDAPELGRLIEELGPKLCHFYAWQHGAGCMKPMPRNEELLQMPGRGTLDFLPMLRALKKIRYTGWTEIFMHATPRGSMIHDTVELVTAETVRAKKYLDNIVAKFE